MAVPKIIVGDSGKYGRSLFASGDIEKDEQVIAFEGPVYTAAKTSLLPEAIRDHCLQIGPNTYIHVQNEARFIAHSCRPNCGILENTIIVAMRDIETGEELTYDYEMTEDSDWRIENCLCGEDECRGTIGTFSNLPSEKRAEYGKYIADWLRNQRPQPL